MKGVSARFLIAGLVLVALYAQEGRSTEGEIAVRPVGTERPRGSTTESVCTKSERSELVTGDVTRSELYKFLDRAVPPEQVIPFSRQDAAEPRMPPRAFALKVTLTRTTCRSPGDAAANVGALCDTTGCEEGYLPGPWDPRNMFPGDTMKLESCGSSMDGTTTRMERTWVRQANGKWRLVSRMDIVVDACTIE